MTASQLIGASMRLLNQLGNDVVLSIRESKYPLEALNILLDSWSTDQMLINTVEQELFTVSTGINPHTWGVGGLFNSERPVRAISASSRIPGGVDIGASIIGYDDYAAISLKSLSTTIARYIYIDNAYPIANVYIYPVPSTEYQILFNSEKPFFGVASLNTMLSLPPGYIRALKYCLAVEIAPEFKLIPSDDIKSIAMQSVAAIKLTNIRPTTLQIDSAISPRRGGSYNIYTNQ
jgi:hypothetical protein